MPLFDLIDSKLLNELRMHLSSVTDLSIHIVDADNTRMMPVAGKSRFCTLIGSTQEGRRHCTGGDWLSRPTSTCGEVREYICEAGLRHLRADVLLNGTVLGGILVGQALVERLPDKSVRELGRRFGIPEDELLAAYEDLTMTSRDRLHEVATLIQVSAVALARFTQLGTTKLHRAEVNDTDESVLGTLFDQVPDGMFITDEAGVILDCNQAAARISGYSVDELRGMSSIDLCRNTHEFYAQNKRIRLDMPVAATIECVGKDGLEYTAEFSAAKFMLGNEVRILTVFRDVSEKLDFERQCHMQAALLDAVHDSVVGFDLDGTITYYGAGAETLHGWSSADVLGKKISVLGLSPEPVTRLLDELVRHGTIQTQMDMRRKDGSTFIGEIRVFLVYDDNGRPVAAVGLCRDVTALRKESDEHARRLAELSRLYDELLETERIKKRLIDNVSHELRTPLTTVSAYVDMLASGNLGELVPAQKRAVDVVQRNVARLDMLVAEMLDSVRMEAGRMVIKRRPVDLCSILAQSVEYIAPMAKAAMVELDYAASTEGIVIDGDESQLARVFTNLLTNAVKFNVSGGHIDVSVHDNRHGLAIVSVRDTGIGIQKHEQERIFDRFYQTITPARRTYGGTGLGLTIAKQIVELHEGHIFVDSEPGHGSEFKVMLPTSRAMLEPTQAGWSDERIEVLAGSDGGRKTVLIVEDDRELLEMLITGFSNHGFAATGVCTGAEGIQKAHTELPDAVVLDLALPDTDGIEVCRDLRSHALLADVPVLGITAWSNQADLDRFAEVGADKIIRKPFVFMDVLRGVVETLGPRSGGKP